jgi:hypothetical protein
MKCIIALDLMELKVSEIEKNKLEQPPYKYNLQLFVAIGNFLRCF